MKPDGGSFTIYYIWSDQLNTPRLITDAANNVRWEWAHSDPFGNNAANENPAGLGAFGYNPRFPGQYYDSETGNHYNYFRDYDPKLSRYLQSDPIGLNGGVDTYGYVGGSPITWSDPTGELRKWVGLSDGWTAGVDTFNRQGGAAFHEIHVYDPQWNEVGVVTEKGWVGKHGGPIARPKGVPDKVCNAINGVNIDTMRRLGQVKKKGHQNIKPFRASVFGVGLLFTVGPALTASMSPREFLENLLAGIVGAGDAGESD